MRVQVPPFAPVFFDRPFPAQKWIERWRADRDRRIVVFKTLMATRAASLSPRHVEALNQIDLEFPEKEFPDVREAWRVFLDHLSTDPNASPVWNEKRADLFADLLGAMSKALGYRFGEVDIKRGAFIPLAHVTEAEDTRQVRAGLLKLLSGTSSLRVEMKNPQLP